MFTKIMDVELGRETAGAILDMNSGREDEEGGDEFAKSGSMCRRCARKTVRCRAHIYTSGDMEDTSGTQKKATSKHGP
jgi:hypothetical protein